MRVPVLGNSNACTLDHMLTPAALGSVLLAHGSAQVDTPAMVLHANPPGARPPEPVPVPADPAALGALLAHPMSS